MSGNNFVNPKHARAKRNVVIGGGAIIFCITLLSCVSSFMIYREGFADMGPRLQNLLSVFAVVVVEGAFIWLVYGFTRAFSSFMERAISFGAMWALAIVMLINIVTHFMMVKGIPLNEFQQAWLAWGAVAVFIGVLVIVLAITLADPVIRQRKKACWALPGIRRWLNRLFSFTRCPQCQNYHLPDRIPLFTTTDST